MNENKEKKKKKRETAIFNDKSFHTSTPASSSRSRSFTPVHSALLMAPTFHGRPRTGLTCRQRYFWFENFCEAL